MVIVLVNEDGLRGREVRSHLISLSQGRLRGLRVNQLGVVWYQCHIQDCREYVMLPRWHAIDMWM